MAVDWAEKWNEASAGRGAATPVGYQQQVGRLATTGYQGDWGAAWNAASAAQGPERSAIELRQPKWLTGGRMGGTHSGWDTDFVDEMYEQYSAMKPTQHSDDLYGRRDFTGIVTSDAYESTRVGKDAGAKFGDYFRKGVRIGNLYEDLGDEVATQILWEHMVSTGAKMRTDSPDRALREVQRARDEETQTILNSRSQKDYRGRVEKKSGEFQDSGVLQNVVIPALGAVGAAGVVGAGILAAPATGGGSLAVSGLAAGSLLTAAGVVGGAGAWLNRDELTSMAANAAVQWDEQEGRAMSQASTGLTNWSMFAQKALLSPVGNLVKGSYDAITGTTGDGVSEFTSYTDEGERKASGWIQAAGAVGDVVDFAAIGWSPAGMGIYQVTMGGTILGKVGETTIGGGEFFDYERGVFRNLWEDDVKVAPYMGALVIDVAQLGLARGLSSAVRSSRLMGGQDAKGWGSRLFGPAPGADGWTKLTGWKAASPRTPAGAVAYQELGGIRYFRTEGGQIMDKYVRPLTTFMAPSELIGSIPPRFATMRALGQSHGAVTGDSVYRTAMAMSTGQKGLANSLINGFGEGVEEFTQELLESYAMGNPVDTGELLEVSLQGFLMGTGMTIGSSLAGTTRTNRLYRQYKTIADDMELGALSEKDFKALLPHKQEELHAQAMFVGSMIKQVRDADANNQAEGLRRGITASTGMIEAAGLSNAALLDKQRSNLEGSSGKLQITAAPSFYRADSQAMSIQQLLEFYDAMVDGLLLKDKVQAPEGTTAEDLEFAARAGMLADSIRKWLRQEAETLQKHLEEGEFSTALTNVKFINMVLSWAYDGNLEAFQDPKNERITEQWLGKAFVDLQSALANDEAELRTILARSATMLDARNPFVQSGSHLAFLPQVDLGLTRDRRMNALYVPSTMLTLINGDYDGDGMVARLRSFMGKEAFLTARSGGWGSSAKDSSSKLFQTKAMNDFELEVHRAFTQMREKSAARSAALKYLGDVKKVMQERLVDTGVMDRQEMEKLHDRFTDRVKGSGDSGNTGWLLSYVQQNYATKLTEVGKRNLTNVLARFATGMGRAISNFHDAYSNINVEEDGSAINGFNLGPVVDKAFREAIEYGRKYQSERAANAASDAANVLMSLPGADPFRQFLQLHVTARAVAVQGASEVRESPTIQDLVDLYSAINSSLVEDAELTKREGENIEARTRSMMFHVLKQGGVSGSLDMAAFARTPAAIPQANEKGDITAFQGSVTATQFYLHLAIQQEKNELKDVAAEADLRRWSTLEQLTKPGMAREADMAVWGDTPLSDLGGESVAPLGNNATMRDRVAQLSAMDTGNRAAELRYLRTIAGVSQSQKVSDKSGVLQLEYDAKGDKAPTGPLGAAMILDTIAYEANNYAPYNEETGLAGGVMGDTKKTRTGKPGESYQMGKDKRDVLRDFRTRAALHARVKVEDLKPKHVYEMLKKDDYLSRLYIQQFPPELVRYIVPVLESGEIQDVPGWVLEALLVEPERGEHILWANSILLAARAQKDGMYSKNNKEGTQHLLPENIGNVYVLMIVRLTAMASDGNLAARTMLEELMIQLNHGESVLETVSFLNRNGFKQPGQPAFRAYHMDMAAYYPDQFNSQWSETDQYSREALTELLSASVASTERLRQETEFQNEGLTLDLLDEVYKYENMTDAEKKALRPEQVPSPDQQAKYNRLKKIIERNTGQTIPTLGGGVRLATATAQITGVQADQHTKGASPAHLKQLGEWDVSSKHAEFGAGIVQYFADFGSTDNTEISRNLKVLTNGDVVITLQDGRQAELRIGNKMKFFLDNWRFPHLRPLLRAMFFDTVLDSPEGSDKLQMYVTSPLSLHSLLTNKRGEEIREKPAGEYMDYLGAEMENLAPNSHYLLTLEGVLNSSTFGSKTRKYTYGDAARQARDTEEFLNSLSRLVGRVSDKTLADLRDNLKAALEQIADATPWGDSSKAAQEARKNRRASYKAQLKAILYSQLTDLSQDLADRMGETQAALVNAQTPEAKAQLQKEVGQLQKNLDQATQELRDLNDKVENLVSAFDATFLEDVDTDMKLLLQQFGIDPKQGEIPETTKAQILQELYNRGTWYIPSSSGKRALLTRFIQLANEAMNPSERYVSMHAEFTDEDWISMSEMIIGRHVSWVQLMGSPLSMNIADFPGISETSGTFGTPIEKFWDPSFSYIADLLLDPDSVFVKASRALQYEDKITHDPQAASEIPKLLDSGILSEYKYVKWDPTIAANISEIFKANNTASATAAVPTSGNITKQDFFLDRHATRTTEAVGDDFYTLEPVVVPLEITPTSGPLTDVTVKNADGDDVAAKIDFIRGADFKVTIPVQQVGLGEVQGNVVAAHDPSQSAPIQYVESSLQADELNGLYAKELQLYYRAANGDRVQLFFPHEKGRTPHPEQSSFSAKEILRTPEFLVTQEGRDSRTTFDSDQFLRRLPFLLGVATDEDGAALPELTDSMQIELEMRVVHPDSKPAAVDPLWESHGNQTEFDGVVWGGNADAQPSLISAFDYAVEGVVARLIETSIKSNKSGQPAFINAPNMGSVKRESLKTMWSTNMSGLARELARGLTRLELTGEQFGPNAHKAALKLAKMYLWVRGKDRATGEARLFSADQIIHMQLLGIPLQEVVEDAELVVPSPRKLRTMLGDNTGQGLRGVLAPADLLASDAPQRLRTNEEILENDPSLANFDPVPDLLDRLAATIPPPRKRRYNQMTPKNLDRFNWATQQILDRDNPVMHLRLTETGSEKYDEISRAVIEYAKKHVAAEARNNGMAHSGSPITAAVNRKPDFFEVESLLNALEEELGNSPTRVLLYEHRTVHRTNQIAQGVVEGGPTLGTLTSGTLDAYTTERPTAQALASFDHVIVDVGTFHSPSMAPEQRQKDLSTVLDKLMDTGVTIVLIDTGGGVDLKDYARQHMTASKNKFYSRSQTSDFVWRFRQEAPRPANERSAVSRMYERHEQPVHQIQLSLISDAGETTEGNEKIITVNKAMVDTPVAVPNVLITKSLDPRFHLPSRQEMGTVLERLQEIFGDPDQVNHIVTVAKKAERMSKKEVGELRDAIQRYVDWLQTSDRPERAFNTADLQVGDLIPFFDTEVNQVYFYRFGHEHTDTRLVQAQLSAPIKNAGSRDTYPKIAIASKKLDSGISAMSGRVTSIDYGGANGVSLGMEVPMGHLVAKAVSLGWKVTYSEDEGIAHRYPAEKIFRNVAVSTFGDMDTGDGKQLDGIVDSARMGFAAFGHNPYPALVETLLGEDYDNASDTERARMREDVHAVMKEVHQKLPKISRDKMANTLQKMVSADKASDFFSNDIKPILGILHELVPQLYEVRDALSSLRNKELYNLSLNEYMTMAALLYVSVEGSSWENIAGFSGVAQWDGASKTHKTRYMDELYTNMFDRLPMDSPARIELAQRWTAEMNHSSFKINPDFTVEYLGPVQEKVVNGKVVKTRYKSPPSWLRMTNMLFNLDNPTRFEASAARNAQTDYSYHNATIDAMANNIHPMINREAKDWKKYHLSDKELEAFTISSLLSQVAKENKKGDFLDNMPTWYTTQQQHQLAINEEAVARTRHKISMKGWDTAQKQAAKQAIRGVLKAYNLPEKHSRLVHYWVRQQWGNLHHEDGGTMELSYDDFIQVVDHIATLASEGKLPVHGGEVPLIYVRDLMILFQHNKDLDVPFVPDYNFKSDAAGFQANDWASWVSAAIGNWHHDADKVLIPLFRVATDGMLNSYALVGDMFDGMPVSYYDLQDAGRINEKTGRPQISLNIPFDESLDEMSLASLRTMSLDKMILNSQEHIRSRGHWKMRKERSRTNWYRRNNMEPQQGVNLEVSKENAHRTIYALKNTNGLLRGLIQLRLINALGKPALPVSAIAEHAVWNLWANIAKIIQGDSSTMAGRTLAYWIEKSDTSALKHLADFLGYKPVPYKILQRTIDITKAKGQSLPFRQMIQAETNYVAPHVAKHAPGKMLETGVDFVTKIQEPLFGMSQGQAAHSYLEAALAWITASNGIQGYVSANEVLRGFDMDDYYIKNNFPDAHVAGLNAIKDTRGLMDNPISLAVKGTINRLTEQQSFMISGVLGEAILQTHNLFITYASNVTLKTFGLQGPAAAAAMLLHGRKKPWAARDTAGTPDAYLNMMPAIESLDLTTEFLKSGVSLTGLVAFGLLAGTFGLTGEDEEDKRRRRMRRRYGQINLYDPRKIENDWRDKDTVFLDRIPILNSLFGPLFYVTDGDSESGARSAANMHWILRQFISPLMGFDRFMSSGDIRDLIWGFEDALGSFPLLDSYNYADIWRTNKELIASAQSGDGLEDAEIMNQAKLTILGITMNYERMIFENSFINSLLYVNGDKYDRDPFAVAIPHELEGIDPTVDKMGRPLNNPALTSYLDEESGEIRQAYIKRSDSEAAIASYAENRLFLSVMASLFTGQFDWSKSNLNRRNMPIKERSIDLDPLEMVEARDLIMSVYNSEVGAEELTYAGARTILHGAQKGTLTLDSPALRGVYLTRDQRYEIMNDWQQDLVQEGIELLGMPGWEAHARMTDMWYGRGDYAGLPAIHDILFSDQIPWQPKVRYQQLNTTYTMGPDGNMWATGIQREDFLSILGLKLLTEYYVGGDRGMTVDERLNSADQVFNMNLGMRALERVEDNWEIPTREEIEKEATRSIEKALTNLGKKIEDLLADGDGWADYRGGYGNSKYSSKGWSSRGGGGGSYINVPKIYSAPGVRDPNHSDTRVANAHNPNIRRASIRRERFSSERGRLKQWQ